MTSNSHDIPNTLKEIVICELNEALNHLSLAASRTENLNDNATYNAIVDADSSITAVRNVLQRSWFNRQDK